MSLSCAGTTLSRPDSGVHNFIFCPAVLKKIAGLFYLTNFLINRVKRKIKTNELCALPKREARFWFPLKILSAYNSRAPPSCQQNPQKGISRQEELHNVIDIPINS